MKFRDTESAAKKQKEFRARKIKKKQGADRQSHNIL
jgi:hypothetical protein